uniref:RNA polymerase sigma-70 factor n=1 Tax=uncultured Draconibacterium sp. TaxID=1573823 RepID=UPI0032173EA5
MNYNTNSLNEFLFIRFKKGDELAFEHIFKELYNKLVGFCIQFVNDREEAKGIAQEAFVNLWFNRNKIVKVTGIQAFLYTSAKSACLKHIRHQQIVKKYSDSKLNEIEKQLQIESLDNLDLNALEYVELNELIKQSIENLPEKSRVVFEKKRFEGKTNKEIAEELGISIKSVEANMTRALKALKANLAEYLPLFLVLIILS